MRNRLGIYFHVPFCKQACTYCDFHFSTQTKQMDEMMNAQLQELLHYSSLYHHHEVQTIYFGGGTPSLLDSKSIAILIEAVHAHFLVSKEVEITMEVNPDDILFSDAMAWQSMGINRVSVGIQSFHPKVLQWMNRAHSAQQAKDGIEILKSAGFENITVDIIYGHGQLTHEQWLSDIDDFLSLNVPHISAYSLTVEPKTALYHEWQKGNFLVQDDELVVSEFLHLHRVLSERGYHHYEVSNYAKPGKESRHNQSYWAGLHYLGIGPSAHSFDGENRRYNLSNNIQYIKSIKQGDWDKLIQWDYLDDRSRWNEVWLIGLRKKTGVDLGALRNNKLYQKSMDIAAENWVKSGHLIFDGNHLTCTPKGWMMLDSILLDFFVD